MSATLWLQISFSGFVPALLGSLIGAWPGGRKPAGIGMLSWSGLGLLMLVFTATGMLAPSWWLPGLLALSIGPGLGFMAIQPSRFRAKQPSPQKT
jgi:hypothetical protein